MFDNEETLGIRLKLQETILVFGEYCNKLCHRAVPHAQPDHFGWGSMQEAQLSKIAVLGDDREVVPGRVVVDPRVWRVVQSKIDHVFGARKCAAQGPKEASWEILVEKKLHPWLEANLRSRTAANCRTA